MGKKIVILSGMPASGKDTISNRICELDKKFVPIKKHRSVGELDKKKDTYYNISPEEFEEKIIRGNFIQYHQRYGRYYGISEDVLLSHLQKDEIPIIHIGRIENYIAFMGNIVGFKERHNLSLDVIHIQLWETAENLRERIVNREKDDEEAAKRIAAMEQEFDDNIEMMHKGKKPYTLVLKNSDIETTCSTIIEYVNKESHKVYGYEDFWGYLKKLEKKKQRVELSAIATADNEKKRDWSRKFIPSNISGISFDGVVILKNTKTDNNKLNVDHCFFDYINIKDETDEIESFRFVSCKIEQARFFKCDTTISFTDCFIEKLILDGRSNIRKLNIEGCTVGTIILEKSTIIEQMPITGDSNVSKIDCRDGEIQSVIINDSKVEYIRINHKVGSISMGNGAILERFSIEKEHAFKDFTKALRTKRETASKGNFSEKLSEAHCQKNIFLAALNQYESDHKYDEADLCLENLRSIECAIKFIESRNIFKKIYYLAENAIVGKALGWGIEIINTLITSAIIILAFALLFYYKLSPERSLLGCIKISVGNFFNLNSSQIIEKLCNLDLAEQIVGVIMLTIFTGVIVRKIIK